MSGTKKVQMVREQMLSIFGEGCWMGLTDEEMDLPFFIDYEPANSYHVFVSDEFPSGAWRFE